MGCVKLVLFFMLYTFLCQLVFSSALPHLCPEDQAHALLQFKHMFTFNPNASDICGFPSPKTLSWNKITDCCSWDGVHCEEMTGQVIELDLLCSGFQGKFHPNNSLFQLSNLKCLIPAEISHLSKLYVLRIRSDDPYWLRVGPYNFELLLKNLTQLRQLDLDSVNISSTIPLNFSSYLTTLPS
ncbi:hypothetical protein T459_21118 [Capsicum annuum]|uniref:Leucine-rich repeat-containing N-terminal plant-type domain-containing protein n=1 Tax=Capsicum annuum TaxID=4072 RepID=A0A2G2YW31_CAPAN|nr:hypothetical protein FXO37_11389 [Capsicum annuum]PHT73841.1 hypothetical protein T459_21118 [Capsicum annuum]